MTVSTTAFRSPAHHPESSLFLASSAALTRGTADVINLAESLTLERRSLRRLIRTINDATESRHIIAKNDILDFVKWEAKDVLRTVRREGEDMVEIGIAGALGRTGRGEALREDRCTTVADLDGGNRCTGLCVRDVGVRLVNPEGAPLWRRASGTAVCVEVVELDATEGLGEGVRAGVGGMTVVLGGRGVGVRLEEGELVFCCRSRSLSRFRVCSE